MKKINIKDTIILQDPVTIKFWQATRPWKRNMGQMKCQKMVQRLGWNRDNDVNKWKAKQWKLYTDSLGHGFLLLVHENEGIIFFLKTTRPFSTDIFSTDLNFGHTCKFIPPPWYNGVGGGWWNPSLEVLICCSILKWFCLQWKAFDLLNKMRYIFWVVALLEACDITNNGCHLGFYQELEIWLKLQEMVIFVFDM